MIVGYVTPEAPQVQGEQGHPENYRLSTLHIPASPAQEVLEAR